MEERYRFQIALLASVAALSPTTHPECVTDEIYADMAAAEVTSHRKDGSVDISLVGLFLHVVADAGWLEWPKGELPTLTEEGHLTLARFQVEDQPAALAA